MKPVTLLGFGAWFALLGFLLGVPAGVMLTWQISREWEWVIAITVALSSLLVVRVAANLKVRMTKANRVEEQ